MKKKISLMILLSFALSLIVGFAQAAPGVSIKIDGEYVAFTEDSGYPFVDGNNRTQVPLRATMEAYGCFVDWDASTGTAIVEKDGKTVKVPVGKSYIIVDGKIVENDTISQIKNERTFLPIRAVLEAFGAYVGWDGPAQTVVVSKTPVAGADMQIHFIDVGQADAILIDYGSFEILIDGGNNADGALVINYIRPFVQGALDVMIATHPDEDHIGGLDDVLDTYQVNTILDSGMSKTTSAYQDYYTAAINEPSCRFICDADMTIEIGGGASLKIIETGDDYSSANNNSVVSQLVYNDVSVLFTGDMEQEAEKAALSKFSDVDVLKVGHHGSKTSSSAEFLSVVKPEYAIVSAGLGNHYNHPHMQTLQRLFDAGTTVYGTFKSGTVIMTTDGTDYHFNTSKEVSLKDAGDTSGNTPDPAYAYIGNKSSKVFHIVSCRYANSISVQNKIYFAARGDAVGYTPCKVCTP